MNSSYQGTARIDASFVMICHFSWQDSASAITTSILLSVLSSEISSTQTSLQSTINQQSKQCTHGGNKTCFFLLHFLSLTFLFLCGFLADSSLGCHRLKTLVLHSLAPLPSLLFWRRGSSHHSLANYDLRKCAFTEKLFKLVSIASNYKAICNVPRRLPLGAACGGG